MPFAAFRPSLRETCIDQTRLFLIGVGDYSEPGIAPVRGSQHNIIAWLIQALRLGMAAEGAAVLCNPAVNSDTVSEVAPFYDLSAGERGQLDNLVDDWRLHDRTDCATKAEILEHLYLTANHLRVFTETRLLLVYSGHGMLDGGQFVLCPQDVSTSPGGPSEDVARGEAARVGRVGAFDALYDQAMGLNIGMEFLDVFSTLVMLADRGILAIDEQLGFLRARMDGLSVQPARSRAYSNTLTPIHLKLLLGDADARTTMVLDACHSGGPGRTLQGSSASHAWIAEAGLQARLLTSSQRDQLSAEARLGARWFGAATWSLTQVLNRWLPVEDHHGYAAGVTNGNLLLRANMLLDALSLNQTLSLSAPRPAPGQRHAGDLPFMGYDPSTPTSVDPNEQVGGIEISGTTDEIFVVNFFNSAPGAGWGNRFAVLQVDYIGTYIEFDPSKLPASGGSMWVEKDCLTWDAPGAPDPASPPPAFHDALLALQARNGAPNGSYGLPHSRSWTHSSNPPFNSTSDSLVTNNKDGVSFEFKQIGGSWKLIVRKVVASADYINIHSLPTGEYTVPAAPIAYARKCTDLIT